MEPTCSGKIPVMMSFFHRFIIGDELTKNMWLCDMDFEQAEAGVGATDGGSCSHDPTG
jgi:hypothetical protein